MSFKSRETFIKLVRLGIGHFKGDLPKTIDWQTIQALAIQQGLSGIIIDGIDKLPNTLRPPKELLLEWIGDVMQSYEYRYELYRQAISELASFYNSHGYKMMILKGYACALNWQKPEHRPCGDIDIWLFGQQKEADALIAAEQGIKVDSREHQHTIFFWHEFMVENHYNFVNIHANRSNSELEKIFKELGRDDSNYINLLGEKVYLPSPNLHALFLIRHLLSHFAATGITFRQILDWAFFLKAHYDVIDWVWLSEQLKKFHMMDFVNCINAICVEDFGIDAEIRGVQCNPELKDKVLEDILYPQVPNEKPKELIKRVSWKIHRWNVNKWKYDLCYKESRLSAFCSGIWSHIIKPTTI